MKYRWTKEKVIAVFEAKPYGNLDKGDGLLAEGVVNTYCYPDT